MRFKTKIEIISEAKDKNEAAEIAGEYLSGNIASGIEMKCHTKPVGINVRNTVGVLAISAIFIVATLLVAHVKPAPLLPQVVGINNAIQPPLKTSEMDKKSDNFKKAWQDRQNKAALESIKQ